MKNFFLALLFFAATASAYGLPARTFTCLGVENYADDDMGIKFQILYSDWDPASGYESETVEFESKYFGKMTLDLKTLRAPKAHSCEGAFLKELESLGQESEVRYFEVNDGNCEGVPSYVLKGYCELTF